MPFQDKPLGLDPDVTAPDGSAVRILCQTGRGSMAHFALPPGAVARAMVHRSVEEIWFVLAGSGRMWRQEAGHESIIVLAAGVSLTIPAGTRFQFRNDGGETLAAVAITMPPWPGEDEAMPTAGPWQATV